MMMAGPAAETAAPDPSNNPVPIDPPTATMAMAPAPSRRCNVVGSFSLSSMKGNILHAETQHAASHPRETAYVRHCHSEEPAAAADEESCWQVNLGMRE